MRARGRTLTTGLLALALLAGACGEGDPLQIQLHEAQRQYWQARRSQERLDIYPNQALAEDCIARYEAVARAHPLSALPEPVPEPDGVAVKLARVGAMAALGAASIRWELGERTAAVAELEAQLRADLPLGALVERRLRVTLAGYLRESGESRRALAVYGSLLEPLAPGLGAGDAAYPDAELLALPEQMVDLARATGDAAVLRATSSQLADYFARLARDYAGEESAYQGLLRWTDTATRLGRWGDVDAALSALARDFPEREPWRADLRRARLLAEHLNRPADCERILLRWSDSSETEAAVAAGAEHVRFLLARGRLQEVEGKLLRMKQIVRRREDRAELFYLWGVYEARQGAWDRARQRWGEAASELPYSVFGMESQLAVAKIWADRGEPRFAARALASLFEACRRNSRHRPGSELADLSLGFEARGDSLLGTLPASIDAVQALRARRPPAREDS